jgi:chaperonin GroEL
MQFDRGYVSPYFVTDPEKMEVVMEDPYILLYDKKISVMQDRCPFWNRSPVPEGPCSSCPKILKRSLATLVVNNIRHPQVRGRQGAGVR